MNFGFWFGSPLRSLFGGVLGTQMEAKAIKKPLQKNIKKVMPKMNPNWSQMRSKMELKSSKMRSWKHLVSRVAPKWPPDPRQDRFWRGFGTILGTFSSVFLTYFWWFLHAFCSSMLQTNTFKITRNHQKNAAESFQETTSLFVPSCIEKRYVSFIMWLGRCLLTEGKVFAELCSIAASVDILKAGLALYWRVLSRTFFD